MNAPQQELNNNVQCGDLSEFSALHLVEKYIYSGPLTDTELVVAKKNFDLSHSNKKTGFRTDKSPESLHTVLKGMQRKAASQIIQFQGDESSTL